MLVIVVGLCGAFALVAAGYLFGVKRGEQARDLLRRQSDARVADLHGAREDLAYHRGTAEALKDSTSRMIGALTDQGEALRVLAARIADPAAGRQGHVEDLREIVTQALAPMIRRERLAADLSDLETGSGRRDDLAPLLDQISEKGSFETVLLSDNDGLPLAVSSHCRDVDRLAATASLVMLFSERMSRDGGTGPLSLLIHDKDNRQTLCRIFDVGGQRLLLTAVSIGVPLTTSALDAALPKVDNVLTA